MHKMQAKLLMFTLFSSIHLNGFTITTRLLSGYFTAKKSKVDMRVRSANAQLRREHHNAQTRGLTNAPNAQTVCTVTGWRRSCADFKKFTKL
jgi:hypothetical protein